MSHFSLDPTLIMTFYIKPKNVHYLGGAQVAYAMAVQLLNEFPLVQNYPNQKYIIKDFQFFCSTVAC